MDLFTSENELSKVELHLKDSEIVYYRNLLNSEEATSLHQSLLESVSWRQDNITIYGKTYPQPRLTALYGEKAASYSYSGIKMAPLPFTSELKRIKNKIEVTTGVLFNVVLINLYRDGRDSNGWHSDDEKELGTNPFIASISLGAKRTFHLRHKSIKHLKHKIDLEHGSLLTMAGATQHFWQHQLPKSTKIDSSRINLTFRLIQ